MQMCDKSRKDHFHHQMEKALERKSAITSSSDGRRELEKDLGDHVNVFCVGAGTNIGQTLGKAGSL